MIRLGLVIIVLFICGTAMWCLKKYVIQPNQHKKHMKRLMAESKELDQQLFEIRRNEGNVFQPRERNK